MNEKDFQKLLNEHDELLSAVEGRHKSLLTEKQKRIFQEVRENFIGKLEKDENGNVKMNASNIAKLNEIDAIFENTSSAIQKTLVTTFASNLSGLIQSNAKYYSAIEGNAKVLPLLPKVNKAMSGWLGITDGTPQKNGFIDQLLKDDTAKIAVKNMAMKIVIGQQGLEGAKDELKTLIEGNKDRLGMFERHYKTFANDLYSQIDRATSNVIRNDLKFEFAIYVGGLVEKSREFCQEHNAKVFHISEILKFDPKVGIPPNYDPIHDLGGYNCRHHLRWISTAMAKAKGKNVEDFIDKKPKVEPKPKTEPKPKEKEKELKKPKVFKLNNPRTYSQEMPFDEIKDLELKKFAPPKAFKEALVKLKEREKLALKYNEALKKVGEVQKKYSEKHGANFMDDNEIFEKYWAEKLKLNELSNSAVLKLSEFDAKHNFSELNKAFINETIAGLDSANNLKMVGTLQRGNKAIFEEAFGNFKKIANGYFDGDNVEIKVNMKKGRAFARLKEMGVYLDPKTPISTIYHEMGHLLENNNVVRKTVTDFLLKRTEGKNVQYFYKTPKFKGHGYRTDEKFVDGGFFIEYVGKIYEHPSYYKGRSATEVVSMGIERFMKDPIEFYKEDKEHFELIYNLFFKK